MFEDGAERCVSDECGTFRDFEFVGEEAEFIDVPFVGGIGSHTAYKD